MQRTDTAVWGLISVIGWNHWCLDFFVLIHMDESTSPYSGCRVSLSAFKHLIVLDRLLIVNGNVNVLLSFELMVLAPDRASLTL
jgi:hypothetical protein